MASGSEVI